MKPRDWKAAFLSAAVVFVIASFVLGSAGLAIIGLAMGAMVIAG